MNFIKSSLISWDKKEISLLIKTYFDIKREPSDKEQLISELSVNLRKYALNLGYDIDEKHRNINGITMCLQMIGHLVTGKGLKPTRLQSEVYQTYLNNRAEFDKLVMEAQSIITKGDTEIMAANSFEEWLISNMPKGDVNETLRYISEINDILRFSRITKKDILKVTSRTELKAIISKFNANSVIKIKYRKKLSLFENALMQLTNYLTSLSETSDESTKSSCKKIEQVTSTSDDTTHGDAKIKNNTTRDNFFLWLLQRKKLSVKSCNNYTSAITACEQFAQERNIKLVLYGNTDFHSLSKDINSLRANPEFCEINSDQHNRLSAALNHFIEFVKDNANNDISIEHIETPPAPKTSSEKPKKNENILKILSEHYKYGFRIDSTIELMRFRHFAEEAGIDIPESDDALKKQISGSGFIFEGKVYTIGKPIIDELSEMLGSLHQTGINVVFYEPFMNKYSGWFVENHIMSVEILKKLIQDNYSDIYCGKNYLSFIDASSESDAIISELRRVWGSSTVMSVRRMKELLEFIPEENIKRCCYANPAITWSHDDFFVLLDRFIISDEQIAEIKKFVRAKCESVGFLSTSDIPTESIEEENYEVSSYGISSAIYKLALQDEFELNGKILTLGSNSLDIVTLLKKFCADKDECSFDEAAEKCRELTGAVNRRAVFTALYDTMVRINADMFVADRHVRFEADAIDELLSSFVSNGYTSIKGVTTFAMFPVCGQIWNHFLLESYCYKFSKKYSLNCLSFNDKNCGIIAEKTLNKSYEEMLCETAANAEIKLTEDSVGAFLFDNGYISKSKSSNIKTIVEKAAQIREGK